MAWKTTLHATNDRKEAGKVEDVRTISLKQTNGANVTINIDGTWTTYVWEGGTSAAADTLMAAERSNYNSMEKYPLGGGGWAVRGTAWADTP